jgi:stress response protein YsnF/hemerythrin-like domain-containing protein
MTTIRQLIQTSPAKANELFAKLADTSERAVKTRERLFSELKEELEFLAALEEQHLFPVLRKHKEARDLVTEAVNNNKQTRKLLTELEQTPKESEEFASKVAELRKAFQQHVRNEKNELLPAILKALSDEEAQVVVETIERTIESEKAEIEDAKRAEAEQRRAEEEAADREQQTREATRQAAEAVAQTGKAVTESSRQVVQSAAEGMQRLATMPLSTGSSFWDAMFGMWVPQSRSVARLTDVQPSSRAEEVIPLAEETLIVGKHTVTSGTTTVRRYVVERPVEERVELYDEKVVVERRKPVTDANTGETLTEVTVEMIETSEVPFVAKNVKVKEEVVVRRERTQRVETVRDTVRRDEIEIAHFEENERAPRRQRALARAEK